MRLDLAQKWYQTGQPTWIQGEGTEISLIERIDFDRLNGLWDGIAAERADNQAVADAYATGKTGYTFNAAELLSDRAINHMIIKQCEYDRLEAAAVERRILAFAACLKD